MKSKKVRKYDKDRWSLVNGEKLIVIGIDQSYQDTGISISMNNRLKTATHCYTDNLKNNSEKRRALEEMLHKAFNKAKQMQEKYNTEILCCIERIRLQSEGFLNINYIKSIGALNALIVDIAIKYDIPVYSVDTRAWKSTIVGTSKGKPNPYGLNEKKFPTIEWCLKKGYDDYIKKYDVGKSTKGILMENGIKYTFNDNICDSICISLYPFHPTAKLKEEH